MKKTGDNFSGNQLTGKSHSLLLACCSLLFLRFSMNSFRLFGFPMDPNRVFRFFPSTPVADFSVFHMDPNRGFFSFSHGTQGRHVNPPLRLLPLTCVKGVVTGGEKKISAAAPVTVTEKENHFFFLPVIQKSSMVHEFVSFYFYFMFPSFFLYFSFIFPLFVPLLFL